MGYRGAVGAAIEKGTWAGVPALWAGDRSGPAGVVLHGLGGAKEDQWIDLERLAAAGYFALAIDAHGHGERRFEDFERRFDRASRGDLTVDQEFEQCVERTARDVGDVLHAALAESPHQEGFVLGFSMGGFVGFRTAELYTSVSTLVCVAGAPPRATAAARLLNTRVLTVHGEFDELVPIERVRSFHTQARALGVDDRGPHEAIEIPGAGHVFKPQEWADVWPLIVAWLAS